MKKTTPPILVSEPKSSQNITQEIIRCILYSLSLPIRLYYQIITAPINYILYAQFCSKDMYAPIAHSKHNCNIREITIPTTNQHDQPIQLEGLCIEPITLRTNRKSDRTIFYVPGSFATIKYNCLPRLIETAEFMHARIIMFNNEGCGDSPGNIHSLQNLCSSHLKALKHLIKAFKITTLNIWSHSNGAFLHLKTLKDLAKSLSNRIQFGIHVLDRTHINSDLIGPSNFVINFLTTLTLGFVITLTLEPLLHCITSICRDTMLYNCLAIAMITAGLSKLFPNTIGKNISRAFSIGKNLDNTYYAQQALSQVKKHLGTFFSISHESDEIIGTDAQMNITKIPAATNARRCHLTVTHRPYEGSKPRDLCDINHNMNLCGEKNAQGEDLLGSIRKAFDSNDKSMMKRQ
tara:strand:- start:372 stop:1586 length:1215 start_codon:yes stop_codon:yes gene_type:complete